MHSWSTYTATHHNAIHVITNEVVVAVSRKHTLWKYFTIPLFHLCVRLVFTTHCDTKLACLTESQQNAREYAISGKRLLLLCVMMLSCSWHNDQQIQNSLA